MAMITQEDMQIINKTIVNATIAPKDSLSKKGDENNLKCSLLKQKSNKKVSRNSNNRMKKVITSDSEQDEDEEDYKRKRQIGFESKGIKKTKTSKRRCRKNRGESNQLPLTEEKGVFSPIVEFYPGTSNLQSSQSSNSSTPNSISSTGSVVSSSSTTSIVSVASPSIDDSASSNPLNITNRTTKAVPLKSNNNNTSKVTINIAKPFDKDSLMNHTPNYDHASNYYDEETLDNIFDDWMEEYENNKAKFIQMNKRNTQKR
ncbi:hypothetical protein ABK040_010862 [Willaertia magna]